MLIFEKALEEPKYSSMYAQLCKKLSVKLDDNTSSGQQNKPPTQEPSSVSTLSGVQIVA